jgi:hypothetical protein
MPSSHGRARWMSPIALLVGLLWASPAIAIPFTATWHVPAVPGSGDPPPPSPFYDCPTWSAGELVCHWIWDQGLEVKAGTEATFPRIFGDGNPYYDATGEHPPFESELTGDDWGYRGYLEIDANCRAGLFPCIHTFTPRNIQVGLSVDAARPPGVFFMSSRGGLIKAPGGDVSVDFAGAEWTDITAMSIGIYFPDACGDPFNDLHCNREEFFLDLYRLTFDATPIPEPASLLLVGTGLLATLRRYRRR